VAGFLLECVAGFIGIRIIEPEKQKMAAATKLDAAIINNPTLSPEDKFQQQAKLWVGNGLDNPAWKQTLTGGYAGVSTLTQGGNPSSTTVNGYQTFKQLLATAPTYAANLAGEKATQFYRAAQSLEETGAADQAGALSAAAKYVSLPDSEKPKKFPVTSSLPDETAVDRAIQSAIPSSHVFGLVGQNLQGQFGSQEIANRIKQDALILSHNGVDPSVAINTAAAKVTQQYTNVNGSVINLANHQVPPYFTTAAQRVVDDYWAAHGAQEEAEGHSKSDLVVQPLNNTPNWMMLYKSGFQPPGNASFNLDDLARANDRNKQDNLNKTFAPQPTPAPEDANPINIKPAISGAVRGVAQTIGRGVANSPQSASVPDAIGKALHGFGNSLFKPLVPLDNQ
jgi:hypothetical protein